MATHGYKGRWEMYFSARQNAALKMKSGFCLYGKKKRKYTRQALALAVSAMPSIVKCTELKHKKNKILFKPVNLSTFI